MTPPPGCVVAAVGLAFEARIARRNAGTIACAGRGEALGNALASAARAGCKGIVSFGIAGGLDPQLATGTPVVADAILGDGQSWKADERWSAGLLELIDGAVHGPILASRLPLAGVEDKTESFRRTKALAVDMESGEAAAFAAREGLPFAAIRVIADPAAKDVPASALRGLRDDGSIDALAVLGAVARRPAEIAGIVRVAYHTRIARGVLLKICRRLDPGFGLLDLA